MTDSPAFRPLHSATAIRFADFAERSRCVPTARKLPRQSRKARALPGRFSPGWRAQADSIPATMLVPARLGLHRISLTSRRPHFSLTPRRQATRQAADPHPDTLAVAALALRPAVEESEKLWRVLRNAPHALRQHRRQTASHPRNSTTSQRGWPQTAAGKKRARLPIGIQAGQFRFTDRREANTRANYTSLRSAAGMSDRQNLRCSFLRACGFALLTPYTHNPTLCLNCLSLCRGRNTRRESSPSKCSGLAIKHNALLCVPGFAICHGGCT